MTSYFKFESFVCKMNLIQQVVPVTFPIILEMVYVMIKITMEAAITIKVTAVEIV